MKPRLPALLGGSIRVRLTLWYVGLLGLTLALMSAFVYLELSRSLRSVVDGALEAQAQEILGGLALADGRASLPATTTTAATVVAVYDLTGERLLSPSQPPASLPLADRLQAAAGQEARSTLRVGGDYWRVLSLPVVRGGQVAAVLQVAGYEQGIHLALDQLRRVLALAVPAALLLAVTGGWFLAHRALTPIEQITRAAEDITAEQLSRRLDEPPKQDEVGRLAATFNRMLERLDRGFERERRLIADASHELRTPLAVLASQMDLALERDRSSTEYRDLLASMREDAARMHELLSELLLLARADVGQAELSLEPLRLDELVGDVAESMTPLAEARGLMLELSIDVPVVIDGDQTRLTQLAFNLIDNAIKYTDRGRISVTVGRQNGMAMLRVHDTGTGIPAGALPHLFERFYRVDKARSRAAGGTGLGLAISHWIAQAHHGEISVASELGNGSTFVVRLPLSQDEKVSILAS